MNILKKTRLLFFTAIAGLYALPNLCNALVFNSPAPGDGVVGQEQIAILQPGETFFQLSRKYDIGYEAIVSANPNVDPFAINKKPIEMVIPSRIVLPQAAWHGIIINVAEMRLYYFPDQGNQVYIFPVGVGRQGWATPIAETFVLQKIKNPYWHVPDSIRESQAAQGIYYPDKVPPGPLDPLGSFALRLNLPGYLIHGTDDPNSVGARSSSGCIRMYPEDIETLFSMVSLKTPVQIIDTPYKVGILNGQLYLEAHQPIGDNPIKAKSDIAPLLQAFFAQQPNILAKVNIHSANKIASQHFGIPGSIGSVESGKIAALE